jgi:hypothetical protein
LLFPCLLILISLFGLQKNSPLRDLFRYLGHYLNSLLIETMRAWGKIMSWSLLLLVPGMVRFVQLTLVPFVVTASEAYDRGEVDALHASTRVVNRNVGKILLLIFVFNIFVPLLITEFFDQYRTLWQTPGPCLALTLLDTYLLILGTQCFLRIFQKSAPENGRL